ncbi:hypothetical protein [Falsibacillus pallidus]|uniref:DUF3992 domain-containing protein n=1 Tax=Falsibacillus pallidus TaxID=493781 RepID=A0A370GVH0_9BACI|nr:hypothetical protein [Falsibacillus pallidus]RDI45913.1 hypothetical protein DFR59_102548 [Falsibacillus pallidus]
MSCKKHCMGPLGWVDTCPPRPERDRLKTLTFENCAPFAGSSNTQANIIFDVEGNDIPVVLAGTIENFSDDGINVIFERTSGNVTRTILAHSSLSFIYDDITRVSVFGFGQEYSGSFKFQATYTIPLND